MNNQSIRDKWNGRIRVLLVFGIILLAGMLAGCGVSEKTVSETGAEETEATGATMRFAGAQAGAIFASKEDASESSAAEASVPRKSEAEISAAQPRGTEPSTTEASDSGADGTAPITGWQGRHYYVDGAALTGLQDVNGKRYYFTEMGYYSGWMKIDGYRFYFGEQGAMVTDLRDMFPNGPYKIKVNKECSTVTVYVKGPDGSYDTPICAFLCSCGSSTPINSYHLRENYRWHELFGGVYGQWCTRIHGSILFHTIYYYRTDRLTMDVAGFNALGTNVSAGCVRLMAGDAKWIYDNCNQNTRIVLYNDADPGPFGKPEGIQLMPWHTWDPSDPTAVYKCMERGCHREFWPKDGTE